MTLVLAAVERSIRNAVDGNFKLLIRFNEWVVRGEGLVLVMELWNSSLI